MTEDSPSREQPGKPVEEMAEEAEEVNPDPITRREALEQRLMEEGRSPEGQDVGQTTE